MKALRNLGVAAAASFLVLLVFAIPAQAAYGIHSFKLGFVNPDGSPTTVAGSHPTAIKTTLEFNTVVDPGLGETIPDGNLKDLIIKLPAGFVGSAQAVPACSNEDFLHLNGSGKPSCPDDTAVGVSATKSRGGYFPDPVYNLQPTPGTVVRLGFIAFNSPVTIEVGVNQKPPYNVSSALVNVSQATGIFKGFVELWGVPAAHEHDPFRGNCLGAVSEAGPNPGEEFLSNGICESSAPEAPFLTLSRACQGPLAASYATDSWQLPGTSTPGDEPDLSDPRWLTGAATIPPTTDCSELSFGPTIAAQSPTTAESPSGLDFDLNVNDPGLTEVGKRAGSDIERAVVSLPQGFTTNPSVAGGLGACTIAQYEAEALEFSPSTGCPESAKVGTVEVTSPLIGQTLDGQLYVAKQGANTFGSLLALYMIIRDESLGILVKQPVRVDPDPGTGRLTATVSEIPQLPFSDFHLHFREGQRAPLITPPTCGSYAVQADLFPYAEGVAPVHDTATLSVSSGAGGGACAMSPGQLPNSPTFTAGTMVPIAGVYSPFVLNLSRSDGSQQLARIDATLPQGLLGKLAGIPYCPESDIAQAASRGGEGEGAKEIASPSCPAASQVGVVTATAGAGTEPLTVTGKAYLAGPYKGAPLSLEIVTPAIAGPFDLGVVAVRTALQVDPITTQITAESDPIPTILHGLPLDLRSISIDMNRQDFTLNPTSCEPQQITGSAISTLGNAASLSQYFQASECAKLKFKPTLKLSLKGATRRAGHPALRALLTYPKGAGYSNIARAQVGLPHSEFLDQGSIGKTCTRPVLLAAACPAKSVYGTAKAWSPLLEKPLEGNVYLVGGFGYKLPALVADLDGQIRVLLVGKIDTDKQKGIRNTFEAAPDAPVSKFELTLKGGPKYGLLENSENLCRTPQRAQATFVAQSALRVSGPVAITNGCGTKAKRNKAQHGKKRKGRHGHKKGKGTKKS